MTPSPRLAILERRSVRASAFLVSATQIVFAVGAFGAELGLLPVWVWIGCSVALLLAVVGWGLAVRNVEAPRRWRAVWIPLAALAVNTAGAGVWLRLMSAGLAR